MHRRCFALALAAALALTSLVLAPGASNAASTAPGWQPAASMAFAGDSNAVALPDGRFFTVSQQGGVEVYDPIADRWSSAGPNVAGGATPVVLGDGRVFVVGGRYTNAVSPTVHARLYDPVSGTWASAPDSPIVLSAIDAATLLDGRALLTGISQGPQQAMHALVFDPVTGSWAQAAAPPIWPGGTLTALSDGRALAVGTTVQYQRVSGASVYDPAAGTWTAVAAPVIPRTGHTATALADGRVLVAGSGSFADPTTAEIFDPASSTWSPTGALNVGHFLAQAARLDDGRVMIVSGSGFVGQERSVEVWDPADGTWSFLSPVARSRVYFSAFPLAGGRAVVFGGVGPTQSEVYNGEDPALPRVATITPSERRKRDNATAGLHATAVNATGGVSAAEFFLDDDPGVGSGQPMTVAPTGGTTADLDAVLGTDIPDGVHQVHVRVADAAGVWSTAQSIWLEVYPDPAIPTVSLEMITPNPKRIDEVSTLRGRAQDDVSVAGAEYFVGTDPGAGQATPIAIQSWSNAALLSIELGTDIPVGRHQVGVRAVDEDGNWSKTAYASLTVYDGPSAPPGVNAPTIAPNPKEVGESASIEATAYDDTGVAAGEYFIGADPGEGNGIAMFAWRSGFQYGISGLIGADVPVGSHQVGVRAQDVDGSWSEPSFVTLEVYTPPPTPPSVSDVYVSPNPKEAAGTAWVEAVAVDDDGIDAGEYFIGEDPGAGNGVAMNLWEPYPYQQYVLFGEIGADVPIGSHQVGVRARDVEGTWSAPVFVTLDVGVTPPTVASVVASPNPKEVGESGVVVAVATDDDGVEGGEFFVGEDPGAGNGIPMGVWSPNGVDYELSGAIGNDLPAGMHEVGVRARDFYGTWSDPVFVTLEVRVTPPTVAPPVISPNPKEVGRMATLSTVATDAHEVVAGEFFVGEDPGAGNGIPMGWWTEDWVEFELTGQIGTDLEVGSYEVGVRARDSYGTWSDPVFVSLEVYDDTTGPVVSNAVATPNPHATTEAANVTATISDDYGVGGFEYFVDVDPGLGRAPIFHDVWPADPTVPVEFTLPADLGVGEHVVGIRAVDINGNWGPVTTTSVVVFDPNAGAVTGRGSFAAADSSDGSRVRVSFDARYPSATARVPTGGLEVRTGSLTLRGIGHEWLALTPSSSSLMSKARAQDGSVWTVRIDGSVGRDPVTLVRLYAPGVDPYTGTPTVVVDGVLNGAVSLRR